MSNTKVRPSQYESYWVLITLVGGVELLDQLMSDEALMANASAKQGLENMGLLFKLLKAYNALDRVSQCIIVDSEVFYLFHRYLSTCHWPVVSIITRV